MSVLVPVPGSGEKEADTPMGRPETTLRFTAPENPKCGITLMASWAVPPGTRVRDAGDGEREKLGVAGTVR